MLKLELKDGDRTIATYTKRDVVSRMLDASNPPAAADAPEKKRKKKKGRRALGAGAEAVATAATE